MDLEASIEIKTAIELLKQILAIEYESNSNKRSPGCLLETEARKYFCTTMFVVKILLLDMGTIQSQIPTWKTTYPCRSAKKCTTTLGVFVSQLKP